MRAIRRSILIIVTLLLAAGVVMVYSSSALYGYERLHDSLYFLKRHALHLCVGFVMMFAAFAVDITLIKRIAKPLMFVSLFLLMTALTPGIGREFGGARRWLNFGPINFQPSELAKIALIVYLAEFFSRKGKDAGNLIYGYLPAVIVAGVTVGLVLLEPDFGTAVDLAAIGGIIIFVSGARPRHLFATVLLSLPVLYFQLFSVSYRRRRLSVFLNPWGDSKGGGFQVIQSLIALASGGLWGVGLGQSRQKLFYLPEPYSDFIFSIIGEELGFVGAGSILLLFMLLLWQGMRIVFRSEDTFGRLIAAGVLSMISLEVAINIGVVTGTLPTKGLPLPFISYGGTSLIFHMAAVGLLLNAAKQPHELYE